jgi:hypothetical protein
MGRMREGNISNSRMAWWNSKVFSKEPLPRRTSMSAEQERWEALGEITGSENQRNRILNIVEKGDWSGEDLAQDRANLRQLILGFPL